LTAVRVTTPSGDTWTVRRRWLPNRDRSRVLRALDRRRVLQGESRRNAAESRWYDMIDIPAFGDELAAAAIVVAAVAVLLVLVLFGWSLVLVGVSIVWLLLGTIVGAVGRVVLRRPWWVEATCDRDGRDREGRDWYVRGFRDAGRRRDEIARQFQHGLDPRGVDA
jgi:hypothetical protein